jgi:hypothetical protein
MKIKSLLMALLIVVATLPLATAQSQECVTTTNCIPPKPQIDVVFVIDSTGSMADEIRTVKTHLTKIIKEVQSGQPSPDLRVGIVTYRDHRLEEHEYLFKKLKLTNNIEKAVDFIWDIKAHGGGDLPEAVADGFDIAINKMNWNENTIQQNQIAYPRPYVKKLIFLIGDAAPHGEGSTDSSYQQGCPDGHSYKENIEDAIKKDIRTYTVSGSGIDSVGIRIFKEIARKTGGTYTYLNYIRREAEEYYEEEGFAQEEVQAYAAAATKDADYDKKTNTILTNTLGKFALGSMKAEAADMGVKYEEPIEDSNGQNNDWIDVEVITGDIVEDSEEETNSENGLYAFFKGIFDKLTFWK